MNGSVEQKSQVDRDPRWEKVWAYVGPVKGYLYDPDADDESSEWADYTELLIEVTYNRTIWYSRQVVHKDDADLNHIPIFKFFMEEMVSIVGGYMSEEKRV